ncbi:acyl-CoA synthetase (AMP-forming)/AMP-acid ligase II [Saccharomonospora marina XMU15]|uniref:Acyl-CoA synthetase (AMP-forming)/AMP-acid ligase II n=1 Tax=Saccharomonospora marina XMU15 TaxID=882083 RepID=H5X5K8_9PSEU|nr:acyl-CoA synthetase [Saccharomonospora marina]EHR50080.1 acyl-CoA synthetase (AMP-forming)/AMP-acid ligase II [Saccharomonospora marina XMU15]
MRMATSMVRLATQVAEKARSVEVLWRAGLVPLPRIDVIVGSLLATQRFGPLAGAVRIAARRDPRAVAIVDERGPLSFAELESRSNALARAWSQRGVRPGSAVAALCRDHRGLVLTMLAAGKLGAPLLLLNTGFAKPQLTDVAVREKVTVLVYDEEFTDVLSGITGVDRFLAWADTDTSGIPTLEEVMATADDAAMPAPAKPGGLILLTSGTTGTPKGAPRPKISALDSAQFLDRIPLRVGEATFLGAPLFHGTGISQFILSLALGCKVLLRRRFDPEATLRGIAEHRCTALVLVPTMLRRIIDLAPEVIGRYDTSSLRIIFVAGSALSPEVGNRATEIFGDVIHNLYGSTEVAVATVATPQDWRRAPGTVGRPPVGCRVALYDDSGRRITRPYVTGRVFVGSGLAFEGYTDGRHKEVIDGLLSSGDVGHFDADGLLFIDGRDDEMIVSGGENVYPVEVENLLVEHPDVVEAAVVGVEDEEFGQRLKAYVVPAEGARLDAEGVREHVRRNLARYKVPRDVEFLPELPRNATGKVLRDKLA